jgi:hypothetical protein
MNQRVSIHISDNQRVGFHYSDCMNLDVVLKANNHFQLIGTFFPKYIV